MLMEAVLRVCIGIRVGARVWSIAALGIDDVTETHPENVEDSFLRSRLGLR